jgi:hypothetical protein
MHASRKHTGDLLNTQLLYTPTPAPANEEDLVPLPGEQSAFEAAYERHYFMADALYIYRRFFPARRNGFFVEVGGLNGVAAGSNSFLFERFLNWRGLMVEASPLNFAQLVARRPLAYRLEAALGARSEVARFSGYGCCGRVAADREGFPVHLLPIGPVLRAMGVHRVDFWSLDVRRSPSNPSNPSNVTREPHVTLSRLSNRSRAPSSPCWKEWTGASTSPCSSSSRSALPFEPSCYDVASSTTATLGRRA